MEGPTPIPWQKTKALPDLGFHKEMNIKKYQRREWSSLQLVDHCQMYVKMFIIIMYYHTTISI